jgi:sec-independent protein translocase protein TatA
MIGDLFDSPWKILIVAAVIIVLFGSAKLPAAARSLGKSMRILKTEIKDLHEDEQPEPVATVPVQAAPQPLVTPAQPLVAQPLAAQPLMAAEQAQREIDDLQRKLADLKAATAQPVPQVR